MIIDIMSEREAIAFSADADILDCVVISIRNHGDPNVNFSPNPHIKAILNMKFYDSIEELPGSMSDSDAERIYDFVVSWLPHVESIVLHCKEGVSRSAGIAAALMKYINGDDSEVMKDKHFHPNMRCYEKMCSAIIDNKERGN